jgi:hypothetical protein
MDIIQGSWQSGEKFESREHYHKFLILCKFAGLRVDQFYEVYDRAHCHYAGVQTPGKFDTWNSPDWGAREGISRLSLRQAEDLLKEAIKKQIGLGTIGSCPELGEE